VRRAVAVVVAIGLWALVCAREAEAQVYTYTDSRGIVHFSDSPVRGGNSQFRWRRRPSERAVIASSTWDGTIARMAREHRVSPGLVKAVIHTESAFDPRAVSPKGALGLMQLMPRTAKRLGVQDPFDPRDNIDGGTRYLRYLMDLYRGNLPLALAAYNAGEGAVETHGGIPPYGETRRYVRKVLTLVGRYDADFR
jgi:soluble lytic murein transglycosylase